MASSGGFKPSPLPPVTDTGMKGFLKWLQREQPEVYRQVAPQVAASFPRVFSDYSQSVTQQIRSRASAMGQARRLRMRGGLQGLGQGDASGDGSAGTTGLDPISIAAAGYGLNTDNTVNVASFTTPYLDTSSPAFNLATPAIDTADAANTTAGTPTSTTSAVAALIAGITGAGLAVNQAQTANAITNLQLQRAQQGLSPLNIGMNANGIPTISGGLMAGGSGLLLLGALAVGGLLLFGRRSSAHA